MAVVDVWADINGQTCNASCSGGDVWVITAPSDCPDGYYTCGFWAKDDAGNIAYTTAILWVLDGKLTCIKWVEDKYRVKLLNQEYIVKVEIPKYSAVLMKNLYSSQVLADAYSCHYVRRCEK